MSKNQKIIFSMYYSQKNTCVKVEKQNLVCAAVQKNRPLAVSPQRPVLSLTLHGS